MVQCFGLSNYGCGVRVLIAENRVIAVTLPTPQNKLGAYMPKWYLVSVYRPPTTDRSLHKLKLRITECSIGVFEVKARRTTHEYRVIASSSRLSCHMTYSANLVSSSSLWITSSPPSSTHILYAFIPKSHVFRTSYVRDPK